MSDILTQYREIYHQVEIVNRQILSLGKNIDALQAEGRDRVEARIEHLKATLEKADDYMLKIKGFQELAKKSITSTNVPTIEAPPGYRINLNRLRNWAMMIDPQAADDPFAQRVYAVAKCDECFLEQKKREFQERIRELEADRKTGYASEIAGMDEEIRRLKQERESLVSGSEMGAFAETVLQEHMNCAGDPSADTFQGLEEDRKAFAPGCFAVPFELGDEAEKEVCGILGEYYLEEKKELLLPLELSTKKENLVLVDAEPAHMPKIDRAVQNYVLSQAEGGRVGSRRTYILDAIRYNTSSAGSLRQIEGSFALEQIPRNPEQLTTSLEQIVSGFGDMDDIIDLYDSVREYNDATESEKKLPLTTLIIYGWPIAFSSRDRELLARVFANYERYGISAIIIGIQAQDRRENDRKDLTEYALFNSYHVKMRGESTVIYLPEDEERKDFRWYELGQDISEPYALSLRAHTPETLALGNDYTKRYDMNAMPEYRRGYRPITVPFGVDGKDEEISITFDKNNYAAYLIGQSGSGKSTLIHTIIAGILRNYHPDDVELWLADFKQVEFKQYIDHTPPHVKYILLDESNELVYDLIEKLNDEMLSRQRLLAKLGKENVEEIVPSKDLGYPLPIIFVILDEFSIMSQAIDEDMSYKLKLQNLLAKGRALGFKFLFASQNYTTGVTGLSLTARDQIQQRIAMKQTKEEINEVLALSPALRTEKVQNWIDTIPPYYALVKQRIDEENLAVSRVKVMYFSDDYASRDDLIDRINGSMNAVETYDHGNMRSYVAKERVFVDGNRFDPYVSGDFDRLVQSTEHASDETVFTLGTPRLMSRAKAAVLSPESREHILLIARNAEQECAAAIIETIKKNSLHQGRKVSIWAYGRNRLWKEYREVLATDGVQVVEGTGAICGEIKRLKEKFDRKESENQIIILLGMDRVCIDFTYAGDGASRRSGLHRDRLNISTAPKTESLSKKEKMNMVLSERMLPVREEITKKGKAEGKTGKQIEEEIRREKQRLVGIIIKEFEQYEEEPPQAESQPGVGISANMIGANSNLGQEGEYNAFDDFIDVVKQGSRLGTHFLLALNAVADMKPMGIRPEEFRHKVMFQVSEDDSRNLISNKAGNQLPERVALYDDTFDRYSVRPYLHDGITWDGWQIEREK